MDTLDLRMKFRANIRKRSIEQIQRTKREVIHQELQKRKQEHQTQQLYKQIITTSIKMYEQPNNYIQILKQALHWQKAYHFKAYLPDTLFNLVQYYYSQQDEENIMIGLIQCIAMIYYLTNVTNTDLCLKSLQICVFQLNKWKGLSNSLSNKIQNRCLVALQNISCSNNDIIFNYFLDKQILEYLECMLQDFPQNSNDKLVILEIYGNVIQYEILHNWISSVPVNFYPNLLEECIVQNYNIEVLGKAVSIICQLLKCQRCDRMQIINTIQNLCMYINLSNFYVQNTEQLVALSLEYLGVDGKQEQLNHEKLLLFSQLLDTMVSKYSQSAKPAQITKCFVYLLLVKIKCQNGNLQPDTIINLIKTLCNYWIDLSIQYSSQVQLNLLLFFKQALSDQKIIAFLQSEAQNQIQQQNSLRVSTWQIIVQFLTYLQLENSQKILNYLAIFNNPYIWELLPKFNKQKIIIKIQQQSFNSYDMVVWKKADQVLKMNQQNQKQKN